MHYQDLKATIMKSCSGHDLEQRRYWYSPAAESYDQARPRYPQSLVQQVIEAAQLTRQSAILEVGCGPGTATTSFAPYGFSMRCLEPNPDFCKIADQNCQSYPNVEIVNTTFEEWPVEPGQYHAVLAASSFHWIPPEIGYPKAAQALHDQGYLILLWNKELQPDFPVYQQLSKVYQLHAPDLDRYEDDATQVEILQGLGQIMMDSGYFQNLLAGYVDVRVTYTADQYLTLLNTYSPHLKLNPTIKALLFTDLKAMIMQELGGSLHLNYRSAFHIAQKI